MSVKPVASYWSATANIGRESARAEPRLGKNRPASYWSATADIGKSDRVSLSQTVIDATYYNRRNVPPVTNRGDAGSAYQAQQTIADIENKRPSPPSIQVKLSVGDERSLDSQDSFFIHLRERLSALSDRIDALSNLSAFNPNAARSTDPEIVNAQPGALAVEAEYSITVERMAAAHQVASDKQSDPYAALGLSGSFKVNGYTVTVTSTDSLADLRDRINYGEDANNDGQLTIQGEDLNGNGTLDHYYQPAVYVGGGKYISSFNYFEDVDKDGQIDPAEDSDADEILTGGSSQTHAEARIEDSRLILKNLEGADKTLRLEDPDDILKTLGFFKTDDQGEKYMVTSVDNKTYNIDPVTALFTVNGVGQEFIDNFVESVIPEVVLSIKNTTSRPVTVTIYKDTSSAAANITAFAVSYNSAISFINTENLENSPVRKNVRLQDFVVDLARETSREVGAIPSPPKSLTDLGLAPSGSLPVGIDVATLKTLEESLPANGGMKVKPAQNRPGLMRRLDELGITSEDDFTITVDKSLLEKELRDKSPEAVFEVFNEKSGGVGVRLKEELGMALDKTNGLIESQRRLIKYYKENSSVVNDLISSRIQATERSIKRSAVQNIFEPVVA